MSNRNSAVYLQQVILTAMLSLPQLAGVCRCPADLLDAQQVVPELLQLIAHVSAMRVCIHRWEPGGYMEGRQESKEQVGHQRDCNMRCKYTCTCNAAVGMCIRYCTLVPRTVGPCRVSK